MSSTLEKKKFTGTFFECGLSRNLFFLFRFSDCEWKTCETERERDHRSKSSLHFSLLFVVMEDQSARQNIDQNEDHRLCGEVGIKNEPVAESEHFDYICRGLEEIRTCHSPCLSNNFVYFVTAGEFTKIGQTAKLDPRLAKMQSDNPLTVSLHHKYECEQARECERQLKQLFEPIHEHGEWFRLTNTHLTLAKSILKLKRNEEPSEVSPEIELERQAKKRKLAYNQFTQAFHFDKEKVYKFVCDNASDPILTFGLNEVAKIAAKKPKCREQCPRPKRVKLDKEALLLLQQQEADSWNNAFDRNQALSGTDQHELDDQTPVWDKACALLFRDFGHVKGDLLVQHAQWYLKYRGSLFHFSMLTMTREQLEAVNFKSFHFLFKRKKLATVTSIEKVNEALSVLLTRLNVSPDGFSVANGTILLTRKQLEATKADILACWAVLDGVLPRLRTDRARDHKPWTTLRRILHYFGRLLEAATPNNRKVVQWRITLDPIFEFLFSHCLVK